jgi:hypothetical protein
VTPKKTNPILNRLVRFDSNIILENTYLNVY